MDKIQQLLKQILQRIENIEKGGAIEILEIPSDGVGYIAIPAVASDPTPVTAGQIWFNTTSSQLKVYDGTTIKEATLA